MASTALFGSQTRHQSSPTANLRTRLPCCFVRSRKRRLLTALPFQNCGKGDVEVEGGRRKTTWRRECIKLGELATVVTNGQVAAIRGCILMS
ncbi:unnamed protein product [Lasius platythorax]|uniref:Uncharacterized protein n=1 Tax=Lasius platythorax TaxID=488582 RepID=A0AAV2NU96_9HYME